MNNIEINPSKPAVASIIWLHGLGANNDDFVPVASDLQNLTGLALRFVFPQAPSRPVTINNGFFMPAWFDITSFDRNGPIDQQGIAASVKQMMDLIKEEKKRGFSADQIIMAGFSQGAVVAMNTLLSYPEKLAGVIALSGYLPKPVMPLQTHVTPVFIGHGLSDEIVPCLYGQAASEVLKTAGYEVSWHAYPMAHSVCDQEIRDIAGWVKGVL